VNADGEMQTGNGGSKRSTKAVGLVVRDERATAGTVVAQAAAAAAPGV